MRVASTLQRQLAIASSGSVALHCVVLLSVFGASLETAEIAGGGASFAMGGASESADGADLTDSVSDVEAEAVAEAEHEGRPTEESHRPVEMAEPQRAEPKQPAEPAKQVATQAAQSSPAISRTVPQSSSRPASTSARANPSSSASTSQQRQPTPSKEPARQTSHAAAGNSKSNQAPSNSDRNSSGAGNSTRTNYAGLVYRHASRHRRANTTGPGEVRIRMVLGMDGRLESSSIARSSGSSRFDRQALMMVRRASPFPRPPVGANRTLVIGIKGK